MKQSLSDLKLRCSQWIANLDSLATERIQIISNSQLIYAAAVITMNDAREIFAPGYLRVKGNLITEVGPGRPEVAVGETLHDFSDDVLLPSFVNTHHHIASSLLQGAEPKHKMAVGTVREGAWLKMSIGFDKEQCAAGASLGYLQLLESGVTTTTDSQSTWKGLYKLDGSISAAVQSGLRVIFCAAFVNRTELVPSDYQLTVSESLTELERLRNAYQNERVTIEPEPLSLPRVTDELIIALHAERNRLMAMHLTYSEEFDQWARREFGHPAVVHLDKIGVLDDSMLLAHPVHFDDKEVDLVAKSGASAAYCAVSNMHMGLAVPDLRRFHDKGISVGLGLDHPNGSHDFFETIKTTMLAQRSVNRDQESFTPLRALEMATRDGAKALKLFDQIGSLEVNKHADLLVIDGNRPEMQPPAGLISQIVTAAKSKCVKHVAMSGVWHLFNYQHQTMKPDEIIANARVVQRRLLEGAGIYNGVRGAR
jgi:5-methylthioadenosine/S-adenosylhomocysteine deaminase